MSYTQKNLPSGVRLQILREWEGLTREELSKALDIQPSELRQWENTNVPAEKLAIISEYFGLETRIFECIIEDKEALERIRFGTQKAEITETQYELLASSLRPAPPLPSVTFERLELENIGIYPKLELDFLTRITVLIGLNGAGKTTILKAIALAVVGPDALGTQSESTQNLLRINGKEGRQTLWQARGRITLFARVEGKLEQNTISLFFDPIREMVVLEGQRFDALFHQDDSLKNLMLAISEQRIGSKRRESRLTLAKTQPKIADLLPILSDDESSCIEQFSTWLANLVPLSSIDDDEPDERIQQAFNIFSDLMQEPISFAGLTRVDPPELWVKHQQPEQTVPLRLASQGYQAVMGWVGLIVKRMFEAYEQTDSSFDQPAIIMIDEIDQLLHVKWQQKILATLADKFFPNTQWIVTTHSPLVVAGLEHNQVIHLHEQDGQVIAEHNPQDLWLWQYGDVVRYLFDVPSLPPKYSEQELNEQLQKLKADSPDSAEIERLEQKLRQLQASRAFVDLVYKEQQALKAQQQELANIIASLKQPS